MFDNEYKDTDRYSGNTTENGYGSYRYSTYDDREKQGKSKKKKNGQL